MIVKKAVLIGHNFNSILGMARALGREGYQVSALRTGYKKGKGFLRTFGTMPEASSRYITKHMISDNEDPDYIVRLLIDEFCVQTEKIILIPVDDVCAEIIDQKMDLLREHFIMPNINDTQGKVTQLMDKCFQKKLAREAGLLVAEGWSIQIKEGCFHIPDEIKYPCFAKAEIPFRARKDFMGRCDNRQELEELLNHAAEYRDCMMLVEEYLDIQHEYCIVGLCDRGNICIPDVIDEMMLGHGAHAGVTCFGRVLAPDAFSTFIGQLKNFLSGLDFQGLFTVDVILCDGQLYFCELNLRMGGSGVAVDGAGVNIVAMLGDALYETQDIQYDSTCREMTFASERPLLNEYFMGYISLKEYWQYIKKADFSFIYSKEDMRPYWVFYLYVLRQIMRKLIKRKTFSNNIQ